MVVEYRVHHHLVVLVHVSLVHANVWSLLISIQNNDISNTGAVSAPFFYCHCEEVQRPRQSTMMTGLLRVARNDKGTGLLRVARNDKGSGLLRVARNDKGTGLLRHARNDKSALYRQK